MAPFTKSALGHCRSGSRTAAVLRWLAPSPTCDSWWFSAGSLLVPGVVFRSFLPPAQPALHSRIASSIYHSALFLSPVPRCCFSPRVALVLNVPLQNSVVGL